MPTPRWWLRRPVLAAVAVLGLAGIVAAAAMRPAQPTDVAAESAAPPAGGLDALATLAGRDEFYLVLDPAASDLRLMYRGAELRAFPVARVERGERRRVFIGAHGPDPWRTAQAQGQLTPERKIRRVAIDPPADGESPVEPQMPPTPEEAYPAPSRYFVQFADGVALEIVGAPADQPGFLLGAVAWSWHRVRATAAALRPGSNRARLRVTMSLDQAADLYRALPPSVGLVVLDRADAVVLGPRPPAPRSDDSHAGSH